MTTCTATITTWGSPAWSRWWLSTTNPTLHLIPKTLYPINVIALEGKMMGHRQYPFPEHTVSNMPKKLICFNPLYYKHNEMSIWCDLWNKHEATIMYLNESCILKHFTFVSNTEENILGYFSEYKHFLYRKRISGIRFLLNPALTEIETRNKMKSDGESCLPCWWCSKEFPFTLNAGISPSLSQGRPGLQGSREYR